MSLIRENEIATDVNRVDDSERAVWAGLASDLRFGARHFAAVRAAGEPLSVLWDESEATLRERPIESNVLDLFLEVRQKVNPTQVMERLLERGIQFYTIEDEQYPVNLKEIAVPPAVLYVRGEIAEGPRVAVVGTRKMSTYGKRVTEDLMLPLVRAGQTIVSGLAHGIDGAAHRATVEAGGITWAILACGVDCIYPVAHEGLGRQILESGGAIISEFPPGTDALRHHFPIRNRIIAGLAKATLVIEAAVKSGSLVTAHSALESNRDVYTVPGSIYAEGSAGPHRLIQMGAKLIHSPDDLLLELGLVDGAAEAQSRTVLPDSAEEAIILNALGGEPILLDTMLASIELDTSTVMSTLTLMEMKGKVRNLGGNQYVRR